MTHSFFPAAGDGVEDDGEARNEEYGRAMLLGGEVKLGVATSSDTRRTRLLPTSAKSTATGQPLSPDSDRVEGEKKNRGSLASAEYSSGATAEVNNVVGDFDITEV
uniref:DUF834 domain-containing protein n=1 Tax=Oryza punctata TaxID=4537 RepID=A0A0E0KFG9_ORYPU